MLSVVCQVIPGPEYIIMYIHVYSAKFIGISIGRQKFPNPGRKQLRVPGLGIEISIAMDAVSNVKWKLLVWFDDVFPHLGVRGATRSHCCIILRMQTTILVDSHTVETFH